jgi:SAM-dependent methyltransferase
VLPPTAERTIPEHCKSQDDRLMYLRHRFAYQEAARRLPAGASVIDIGCGEGYGADSLAHDGRRAVGADVDLATMAQAARRYGRPACRYVVYDGARLPFASGVFDAATTFQVIEHVADDRRFVAEAARLLRPGALFIVTTPNRLLRLDPGQRPWNRYHVREYAPDDLRNALKPHFARVEILGIEGDADTQAHELARLAWVRRTVARDPLGLRRLLSEGMKRRILKVLRGRKAADDGASAVADLTMDRYRLTASPEGSLDLFAVCTA